MELFFRGGVVRAGGAEGVLKEHCEENFLGVLEKVPLNCRCF